jgi:hypothetical protein
MNTFPKNLIRAKLNHQMRVSLKARLTSNQTPAINEEEKQN